MRRYSGGVSARSLRQVRGGALDHEHAARARREVDLGPELLEMAALDPAARVLSGSPPANRFHVTPPDHVVPAMIRPSGRVAARASIAAGLEPSCEVGEPEVGRTEGRAGQQDPSLAWDTGVPREHGLPVRGERERLWRARPRRRSDPAGTKLAPPSDENASHRWLVERPAAISTPSLSRRRIWTCSTSIASPSAVRTSQAAAPAREPAVLRRTVVAGEVEDVRRARGVDDDARLRSRARGRSGSRRAVARRGEREQSRRAAGQRGAGVGRHRRSVNTA